MMQYFDNADQFLALFEVNTESKGAEEFACLADLLAVMKHFPQYGVTVSRLATTRMRQLKWSPRVYWSQMRRALRPILEAEPSTLRALGLPLIEGAALTCPYLAECLAQVVTPEASPLDADTARLVAEACGRAK